MSPISTPSGSPPEARQDVLRLLRQHAGDIGLVLRLNAQYGSMVRTSLSMHGRLMRVQALRQKRHANGDAANEDVWAQNVAEQSMLAVLGRDAEPLDASPKGALNAASPKGALDVASIEAPDASVDQSTADNVSENGTNSHYVAIETWVSEQARNASRLSETDLREVVRKATAKSRSGNSRRGPGIACERPRASRGHTWLPY